MKIDFEHFSTYEYKGEKWYTLEKIDSHISAFIGKGGHAIWFDSETLEEIGTICESNVRSSWKRYFNATFWMGWNGKKATKKEFYKTLATRSDYATAVALMKETYYNTIKA